ncbi:MAG TPA: hypothetical protein VKU40_03775 [Thermoanaerobaculia bacterium]|nr:hypothetical protein [Thermoanaerobaculia bacterium]
MSHDELKEELLASDQEYRRLHDEHQEYEQRLEQLHAKSLLSQDDEIEEKKIKLHKLALKDQMEHLARQHAEARVLA